MGLHFPCVMLQTLLKRRKDKEAAQQRRAEKAAAEAQLTQESTSNANAFQNSSSVKPVDEIFDYRHDKSSLVTLISKVMVICLSGVLAEYGLDSDGIVSIPLFKNRKFTRFKMKIRPSSVAWKKFSQTAYQEQTYDPVPYVLDLMVVKKNDDIEKANDNE
ncbi:hypothetical protein RhiirA5_374193 [Rhizophagus irregularis]|uniref:Uncharacterized protein n=1 Tax=Rhizophagus irregularis TaxID=588596 RepID=A0A2N0PW13_9GLOM|nr:hypothetical protein RhiirA5_374193 [Rhizophagus irregularis]